MVYYLWKTTAAKAAAQIITSSLFPFFLLPQFVETVEKLPFRLIFLHDFGRKCQPSEEFISLWGCEEQKQRHPFSAATAKTGSRMWINRPFSTKPFTAFCLCAARSWALFHSFHMPY